MNSSCNQLELDSQDHLQWKNPQNIFWKVFYSLLKMIRSQWFITASSENTCSATSNQKMWFITESHLLPVISCPRSIFICSRQPSLLHSRCQQLLSDWFSCLLPNFKKLRSTAEASMSIPEVNKSLWRFLLVTVECNLLFLNRSWSVWGMVLRFLLHFPFLFGESDAESLYAQRILDTLNFPTPTTEALSHSVCSSKATILPVSLE
jgi:hypothetical protein